jgi:hypothetical protein
MWDTGPTQPRPHGPVARARERVGGATLSFGVIGFVLWHKMAGVNRAFAALLRAGAPGYAQRDPMEGGAR